MNSGEVLALSVEDIVRRMVRDHDRLDELLREAVERVEAGDCASAKLPFDLFHRGVRREIWIEETILFPLYETQSGARGAWTEGLRREHGMIVDALEDLSAALGREDAGAFLDAHDALMNVLTYHELKEERSVFPAIDRTLTVEQRAALLEYLRT